MAILHNLVIKVLSEIKNFVFKLKTRSCISFTKASVRWTLISCGGKYFTRETMYVCIFAEVDLLPVDNEREKKNRGKKYKLVYSSKTTDNIYRNAIL